MICRALCQHSARAQALTLLAEFLNRPTGYELRRWFAGEVPSRQPANTENDRWN
jgi:hypothetical protein